MMALASRLPSLAAATGYPSTAARAMMPRPPMTVDRVLHCDQSGSLGVYRVVPAEETIRGLSNPIEGHQHTYDDLSHALHLRLVDVTS